MASNFKEFLECLALWLIFPFYAVDDNQVSKGLHTPLRDLKCSHRTEKVQESYLLMH